MNRQSTAKLSTMLAAATGAALAALVIVATLYSTGIVSVPVFGGSFDQPMPNTQASRPTSEVAGSGTAADRAPLNTYASGVRNDLFRSADVPDTTRAANSSSSVSTGMVPASEPSRIAAPAANGSVWMYTGTVSVGSKHYAVIENALTHSGRFLQAGDRFGEGKVKAFSPEAVTLIVRGRTEHLYKNRNYSLVPLSNSAQYLKVAASTTQPSTSAARPGQTNQANAASTATAAQTPAAAGQAQLQTAAASTSNTTQVEAGFVPANPNPVDALGGEAQKAAPAVQLSAPLPVEIPAEYAPTRAYQPIPNGVYPNVQFLNARPGWMGTGPGRGR